MQRRPKARVGLSRCFSPAQSRAVRVGAPPRSCASTFSFTGAGIGMVEGVLAREEGRHKEVKRATSQDFKEI